jgi:hypothetical protein
MNPPLATSSAGSLFQSGNQLLSDALNIWGQVEVAKAQRSTSGADSAARVTQPDIPSGQTVNVDSSYSNQTRPANNMILGMKPKSLLVLGGLVVAFGFALKGAGFK